MHMQVCALLFTIAADLWEGIALCAAAKLHQEPGEDVLVHGAQGAVLEDSSSGSWHTCQLVFGVHIAASTDTVSTAGELLSCNRVCQLVLLDVHQHSV